MVERRNRKTPTIIDVTASTTSSGVQYYQTTLRNAYGNTDGFASSIWPMGTNVSFHNTGTSIGGDFGELNKLNYDNAIELYTPGRNAAQHYPLTDSWRYAVSCSYISSSVAVTGSGSISCLVNPADVCDPLNAQIISFSYDGTFGSPTWGQATLFTGSAALYLPENKEFSVEFEFSSSGETAYPSLFQSQLLMALVPSGTDYMDSKDFDMASGATRLSASLGLTLGSYGIGTLATSDIVSSYVPWTSSLDGRSGPGMPLPGQVVMLDPPGLGWVNLDLKRKWKISRRLGPTLTSPEQNIWYYEWSYEDKSGTPPRGCWIPFARIDAMGSGQFATQSYYCVLDFGNITNQAGLTASCISPSIQTYHTKSWRRSDYTVKPTSSVTYCYPGGFLTNDYPDDHYGYTWFPEDLSNPGANKPYKDYGLMWNVANERATVFNEKRYPSYESYEKYSWDTRTMGKDYSIIPEFTISKYIKHMIKHGQIVTDFGFLTLDGAEITSSGEGFFPVGSPNQTDKGRGTNKEFYKEYSNSDFETDLDYIVNQHVGQAASPLNCEMKYFTISCDAILKLLPYEGFYPITRTTQLANLFSSSVDTSSSAEGYNVELLQYNNNTLCWDEVKSAASSPPAPPDYSINYGAYPALEGVRTQGITTPIFHPGMLYNSIKSGISVSWTIVTSSNLSDVYKTFDVSQPKPGDFYDSGSVLGFTRQFLNTCLYQNPDIATKIPFEATYDLAAFPKARLGTDTDGGFHINYPEALQGLSTPCGSGAFSVNNNYMIRMKRAPTNPTYELAMNNFLAETVRFFLRDRGWVDPQAGNVGQLTTFKSATPLNILTDDGAKPIVGATYYMDVILECVPEDFTMCKSYWARNGLNERKYYKQFPASGSTFGDIELAPDGGGIGVANLDPGDPFVPAEAITIGDAVVNFSCSFDGRYFGPSTQKWKDYWNPKYPPYGAHYNVCDPAQAPYTPPYYYGASRVTLKYKAGREWEPQNISSNVWTVVFSKLTASYYNPELEQRISEGGLNVALGVPEFNTASFAYAMAQNVGDSLNLFGTTNEGAVSITPGDRGFGAELAPYRKEFSSTYNPDDTRWVIAPKWECPVLNFNNQSSGTITIAGGLHPTCSFSSSGILAPIDAGGRPGYLNNIPIGLGTGMWSGYGEHDPTEGVRIRLDETPGLQNSEARLDSLTEPGAYTTYNNSLLQLTRFRDKSGGELTKYIGELAPERTLSEAIVAIPFVNSTIPVMDSKFAPTTDMGDPYSECFGHDRFFFTIDPNVIFEPATRDLRQHPQTGELAIASSVVKQMVERMKEFVLPPQLDFVQNNSLKPIVMYILPLSVKFSQRDLQDIWQGVLPGPGVIANPPGSVIQSFITHDLTSPFYQGKVMPPNIRWMVFKVKERGEGDYSKVTTTMTDGIALNISERGKINNRVFTYNWPYDFCSLIELAKIETNFSIRPKPTVPEPAPPTSKPVPPVPPPPESPSGEVPPGITTGKGIKVKIEGITVGGEGSTTEAIPGDFVVNPGVPPLGSKKGK